MKTSFAILSLAVSVVAGVVGCAAESDEHSSTSSEALEGSPGDGSLTEEQKRGKNLFFNETFGGNGRRCGTCHLSQTGTINPDQVQNLSSSDPLFMHDAADKPGGNSFTRVKKHATIRVDLPLPPNVSIVGSKARTVSVFRGIPTTMNVAGDPVLMADGRAPNLEAQAKDAIFGHAQTTKVTDGQLSDIAAFERILFNEGQVKNFVTKGIKPVLPEGESAAQKRGRVWFVEDSPTQLRCVHCHDGPMLNETTAGFEAMFGIPTGFRFMSSFVSELNFIGNPVYTFRFENPDGTTTDYTSPDPGLALQTGDPMTADLFKIPTLWGTTKTAPYFHDNSAKDLTEMMEQYDADFNVFGFDLTEQDKLDIIEYMKLAF